MTCLSGSEAGDVEDRGSPVGGGGWRGGNLRHGPEKNGLSQDSQTDVDSLPLRGNSEGRKHAQLTSGQLPPHTPVSSPQWALGSAVWSPKHSASCTVCACARPPLPDSGNFNSHLPQWAQTPVVLGAGLRDKKLSPWDTARPLFLP